MQTGDQIRLVNSAFDCEAVYFLDPLRRALINNRLIKSNLTLYHGDPTDFVSRNIVDLPQVPLKIEYYEDGVTVKRTWHYHGEIKKNKAKPAIRDFCAEIEKALPKDYEFHEIGVCVSKNLVKGKFGNIEIKYRPKNVVPFPGFSPDRMIVINLHICMPVEIKKEGKMILLKDNLRTDTVKIAAKAFLNKVKNWFQYADPDSDYKKVGFGISEHPKTTVNIAEYKAAKAALAMHQPKFSLVMGQLKANVAVTGAVPAV